MSVLSADELRKRLAAKGEARLVVAPILNFEEQLRDSQASLDVRLGCHFHLADATAEGLVDTLTPGDVFPPRTVYVALGEHLVLHPHQFVLGETLEFVRLPLDLMAYVVGRSSWGREGLIVATAVGIHPGYSGIVTLELRNLGEVPICLYPGLAIAQLFVHTLVGRATKVREKFAGATAPERARPTYGLTQLKLDELRKRYKR